MTTPTVYIKLPVNREGFIDPPNAKHKEEKLWKTISKSKKTDIDWSDLSRRFGVPVSFLQWRAFGLYEIELEQLRKKIKRSSVDDTSGSHTTHSVMSPKEISMGSSRVFESPSVSQVLTADNATIKAHLSKERTPMDLVQSDEDADGQSDGDFSDLNSSNSDDEDSLAGSALLYRSRIFSKKPSMAHRSTLEEVSSEEEQNSNDTDEFETVGLDKSEADYLSRNYQDSTGDDTLRPNMGNTRGGTTTSPRVASKQSSQHHYSRRDSNVSNIIGSITREDLEEALLSNSHF
ncbi:hypothetical protein WICPIJ_003299 [Wickerhamomyces pijperi]|uniref:Autophagy-related protein 29 n=1 Tax=Wickerhamomyces pijperi TaxID=599730 RepID=A0A9P8TN50_WICPI|nr:hypothetical protein WICPIJ_003299 [Wickerhamomyces pijperi]